MKSEKVKEMLDSCYMAKRILDMLPKLPEGVLPSYVRYLETIIELEEKNQKVKVSDVSEVLNLPRPGVTRTINAMEEKGYLKKETAKHDGRVTYVTVTKEGKMIFEKYNKNYFQKLALCLNHVSNDEADCMIQTIEKFYEVMCEGREK
ncbi:MarR family transcriptional regulator [Coprobacillus sp. AM17-34]|uniref:MarR family transcriptional regulator n=2 Tax=Faecalibacillus intestinalis TaxID=1982626 RepID=A0AAW4VK39_9FIRM|nr:MarR family transcriptional regulator [Faecalibacillus intestinalis]MCB8562048.1 MarR family transcriptional regulator [Faecalibacillus intestinalis]MCG4810146.1 MarR family transcriptional regulator [Faecalibacillus intestinalis]RHO35077.1 MarR family transcriptional regulator [Coprobacillus sp. AM17-34]